MRRFPRREAEVAALAGQIISGLSEKVDDFPKPPVDPAELRKSLDAYKNARNAVVAARAAFAKAVAVKDEALQTLVHGMKAELRYAEIAVNYDNGKLKPLGWRNRKEPSPMQNPGQVMNLRVIREGRGWVSLEWKKPRDGGQIAIYLVQVSHHDMGEFQDAGRSFEAKAVLEDQKRGVELEYRVVAVNKAGEGVPSNSVTVLL